MDVTSMVYPHFIRVLHRTGAPKIPFQEKTRLLMIHHSATIFSLASLGRI